MVKYLLDTNHAGRLMGNDKRIIAKVRQAEQANDEFSISMTVVGELFFAVYAGQQYEQNLQRLTQLLSTLQIYPYDQMAAAEFGRIQAQQKMKGASYSSTRCPNRCGCSTTIANDFDRR